MYISRSVRVCVCVSVCVCWMYVYVHKTTEIVVSELWFLYTPKLRSLIWWVIFPSYPKYCWFIPSKKKLLRWSKQILIGGLEHLFPYVGNFIIPTDLQVLRGVGQPPTRIKHVAIQGGTPKVATLLSVYTSTWWSSFYWSIGPNNLL